MDCKIDIIKKKKARKSVVNIKTSTFQLFYKGLNLLQFYQLINNLKLLNIVCRFYV